MRYGASPPFLKNPLDAVNINQDRSRMQNYDPFKTIIIEINMNF